MQYNYKASTNEQCPWSFHCNNVVVRMTFDRAFTRIGFDFLQKKKLG